MLCNKIPHYQHPFEFAPPYFPPFANLVSLFWVPSAPAASLPRTTFGLQISPQAVHQRSETDKCSKTEGFETMPARIHCKIQENVKIHLPTSRRSCRISYKNGNGYIVKNSNFEKLTFFVRQHLAQRTARKCCKIQYILLKNIC